MPVLEQTIKDLEHYASTHGPGPDRRAIELKNALKIFTELQALADLVLRDIDDQSTGWFYQFKTATEKAGVALTKEDI